MRAILRHRPSPAMVVACSALAVALGGTSYAAIKLPAGSVGTKQLKKNAVTSPKVKNDALTGADVLESSLAQVPSAASATNATHATNADHATGATSATTAGTANAAFSTHHQFTAPGQVALLCADGGEGDVVATDTKITAIQVAQLTNTPF